MFPLMHMLFLVFLIRNIVQGKEATVGNIIREWTAFTRDILLEPFGGNFGLVQMVEGEFSVHKGVCKAADDVVLHITHLRIATVQSIPTLDKTNMASSFECVRTPVSTFLSSLMICWRREFSSWQ